jgi:hypothetical protein
MIKTTLTILAILLALALVACSPQGPGSSNPERVQIVLPLGDEAAGKQAFIDLGCTACHAVGGVEGLPATVLPEPGPDLAVSLAGLNRGGIATGMIAPAHVNTESRELWTDWEEGQRVWLGPGQQLEESTDQAQTELSRMSNYGAVMTVQQLKDLVAFLEEASRE